MKSKAYEDSYSDEEGEPKKTTSPKVLIKSKEEKKEKPASQPSVSPEIAKGKVSPEIIKISPEIVKISPDRYAEAKGRISPEREVKTKVSTLITKASAPILEDIPPKRPDLDLHHDLTLTKKKGSHDAVYDDPIKSILYKHNVKPLYPINLSTKRKDMVK